MLTGSLVENLITLLVYSDQHANIIRNMIPINMWSVPYRLVAVKSYEYIDIFKCPPKDHIADLLEDKLIKNDGESKIFTSIIGNMQGANLSGINAEYVLRKLNAFIRRQSLRNISVDLTKALQKDTEESLDQAEQLLAQAKHIQAQTFDPGIRLNDKVKALRFLDQNNEAFITGIHELDKRGLGPCRKELWMAMADAKRGKSMLLIHLAKMAAINRAKVVHITLEMSAEKVAQRYLQTFHSISKRAEPTHIPRFKLDDEGVLVEISDSQIIPSYSFDDPQIRGKLEKLIDRWKHRHHNNIFIKAFPTGTLTISELTGYLDSLEQIEKFQPDVVIVDYPELMKLDKNNYRLSIDETYKDLRGMAGERNIAMIVVSQTNRGASQKKIVNSDSVAESYGKIANVDVALSLNATSLERRLGLLRMTVTNARNDEGNFTVVVSQNYATSTFSVDAVMQPPTYWGMLPDEGEEQ